MTIYSSGHITVDNAGCGSASATAAAYPGADETIFGLDGGPWPGGADYHQNGAGGVTTTGTPGSAHTVDVSWYASGTKIYGESCGFTYGNTPPSAPPAPTGLTVTLNPPSGFSLSWNASSGASVYNVYRDGEFLKTTTGTATTDNTSSAHSYYVTATASSPCGNATSGASDTAYGNVPPSAPTLTQPATNANVNGASTVRLGWTPNDPGDTQTAYSLKYKIVGAPSWTTVITGTTDTFRDFPSGTFANGNQYEWQVQTTDTAGNVSPWSASSFFTAATPPPAPTISTPTAGSTLTGPTQLVTITTNVNLTQLNYRVYGDKNGAPDPNNIIDPGQVLVGAQASAKQFTVQGLPNGETVHVEASVFDGNLWSPVADAAYPVLFTPPPAPVASATIGAPTDAAVTIAWASPTPTGGQPAVESVTVSASPDGGETVEWSLSGLDPSGMTTFWTPASGVDYLITVTGTAANGSTATTTTD